MAQTSSIITPSLVAIVGRALAVDKKVWFFCLSISSSRFRITKFVITETLWSSSIFKIIMVPLHRGRFVVLHLYSSFSIDPQNFLLGANLYQKCHLFAIFHFEAITVKFGVMVRSWDSLAKAKLCKNRLNVPLWGKFIPKITNFGDFGACKPTVWKPQRWDLARGGGPRRLGLRPPRLILYKKNSLKGIRPLGANFYRKFKIFAISNFRNI